MKILKNINQLRVEYFLELPENLRKESSYPKIIDSKLPELKAPFKVMLNAKQPQDWGSSKYDQPITADKLLEFLENEYSQSLQDRSYKPNALYQDLKDKFKEIKNIGLILNNIIKIGYRGTMGDPNNYNKELNESVRFSVLDVKEYVAINPNLTIILASPSKLHKRVSFIFMNDEILKPLSYDEPLNIYEDFMGNPVIHTSHPRYWMYQGEEWANNLKEQIIKVIREEYAKWETKRNQGNH